MKTRLTLCILLAMAGLALEAAPLGTAFSYQGFLSGAGAPATGNYDFQFTLFDAANNGNQVGSPLTDLDVAVNNGQFLVTLDFGNVFQGQALWLAMGVRTNGSSQAFTAMTPLQALTPTPYALYATNAGETGTGGSGSVTAGQLSVSGGAAAPGEVLAYNGVSLVWTNPTTILGNAGTSGYWSLTGNSGTTPNVNPYNYLGTADGTPLHLAAGGTRGWDLEPTGDAANIVGGAPGNFVGSGVIGGTIGGGGTISLYGRPYTNSIFSDNGTIGGGLGNMVQASAIESTIAGGNQNVVQSGSQDSSIGGGYINIIVGGPYATIGGGDQNQVQSGSQGSSISGGFSNTIEGGAPYATIGGGVRNTIDLGSYDSTIGGGAVNLIETNAYYAVIAGGQNNEVQNKARNAFIGGGSNNVLNGFGTTIVGGQLNYIAPNSPLSFVGGGFGNYIDVEVTNSFIGGGDINYLGSGDGVIVGGYNNYIEPDADFSFIGGGQTNFIGGGIFGSTIGGGSGNTIEAGGGGFVVPSGSFATIAGGIENEVEAYATGATIGGGIENFITDVGGTVPGGQQNIAGAGSFAAGTEAEATNRGCFVWSDGSSAQPTATTQDNQFIARASGGFIFYSGADNAAGIALPAGSGSWSPLSDRNAKENFETVDPQSVLSKVAALPITTWNYKAQGAGVRHIGPMAQDFHAAFAVGEDERHIPTIDEDGVALAAIQGLNTKLEKALKEKAEKIARLEKELSETKSREELTAERWEARFDELEKKMSNATTTKTLASN